MELADLKIPSYQFPRHMAESLRQAFSEFDIPGMAFGVESRLYPFDVARGRKFECTYRALGLYAAAEIATLFVGDGAELHEKIFDVMTDRVNGILLKGFPEDVYLKGMFFHGLRTLFGGNEEFDYYFIREIPEIISREPRRSNNSENSGFHFDKNAKFDMRTKGLGSFLFMASAQKERFMVPTLFKFPDAPDEKCAEHYFEPNDAIIVNNTSIEHSTGVGNEQSGWAARKLIRCVAARTTLSHSLDNIRYVGELFREHGVPSEQEGMKEWLLKNIELLKQTKMFPGIR